MGLALFKHGNPLMPDYTPSSAVAAGTVVVVGDMPLIAHRDIAANELGALAAGGGVYNCIADAAIAVGKKVYWVVADGEVSETKGANTTFGYIGPNLASAADQDVIPVIHVPGLDLIV